MKFAIVNDPHLGPTDSGYSKGVQRKLVSVSERLLTEFVDEMNVREHPEFVVNLGDSIEDVNDKIIDVQSYKKVLSIFSKLEMPIYTLIGNHDVRTLSAREIAKMLGYKQMHYSFDHGSYHFVSLSFEMTGNHTQDLEDITAKVPEKQIEWLKADLLSTKKPTVVFIHYPLVGNDMKGNFWFESQPDKAVISNRKQVRKILEGSKKVKAVFSAHQHWNKMHILNGIPYFIVTSLVENFKNDGVPTKAHTIVNLDTDKIIVNVKGNDPAQFNFS